MKWAVFSGVAWCGLLVGNSLPAMASERMRPRRVSSQQVE